MASINIKHLQAFVAVADHNSFRRAAARLYTTQPNISARISGLEHQLGTRLFDRDAGSVRLTVKGSTLLPRARAVLKSLDDLIVAADDETLFDGTLRLGVTEMIVYSWLGTYLKTLKSRFPNVTVDLTVDLSTNLSDALANRTIDLALQTAPFPRRTSGTVALGSYPMVWVGAPELGKANGEISLETLGGLPILTHARGTIPFEQISAHLGPQTNTRLVPSSNIAACLQMTLDGLGIACLPRSMVQRELSDTRLELLSYRWHPDPLDFFARYHTETAAPYVEPAALIAQTISNSADDTKN